MATQTAVPAQDRGKTRQSPAKPKFAPRRFGERAWRLYRLRRTTELVEHVGGSPNPVQKGRIDRLVELEWELRKHVMSGDLSVEQRLEFEKLIARYERELGLQPAAAPAPSLQDVLADIARRRSEPEEDDAA